MKEYDKSAIKVAEEKELFDTSVDPRYLELDEEERKKLQEKLDKEGSQKKEEEKGKVLSIFDRARKQKEQKQQKVGFFQKIITFFKKIFSFGGESSLYREVKRLKLFLSEFKPPLYDPKKERVTIAFIELVYKVYQHLEEIKYLFEEAFMDSEEINYDQHLFILDFVEEHLSVESREIIGKLKEDRLIDLFEDQHKESADFDKTAAETKEEVNQYLDDLQISLNENDEGNIESALRPFEKLLNILNFNFVEFFKIFDPAFVERLQKDDSPQFMALPPDKNLGNQLHEMYSYFLSVNFKKFDETLLYLFDKLLIYYKKIAENLLTPKDKSEFLSENQQVEYAINDDTDISLEMNIEEDTETEEKTESEAEKNIVTSSAIIHNKYSSLKTNSHILTETLRTINMMKSNKILPSLMKVSLNTTEVKVESVDVPKFLRDKYEHLLITRLKQRIEKVENLIEKNKIYKEMNEFFNINHINELPKVGIYNEEFAFKLRKRNVEPFSYIHLTQVFKGFIEQVFKGLIKKTISIIIIQADFLDKPKGQRFSELFYDFDNIIEEFNYFENHVSEESDDIKTLNNFAAGQVPDKKFKNIIQKKVYELDERIKSIIDGGIDNLKELNSHIKDTLKDYKSSSQEFILNIKNIGGSANKEYMANLSNIHKDIDFFLKVARYFETSIHH